MRIKNTPNLIVKTLFNYNDMKLEVKTSGISEEEFFYKMFLIDEYENGIYSFDINNLYFLFNINSIKEANKWIKEFDLQDIDLKNSFEEIRKQIVEIYLQYFLDSNDTDNEYLIELLNLMKKFDYIDRFDIL